MAIKMKGVRLSHRKRWALWDIGEGVPFDGSSVI